MVLFLLIVSTFLSSSYKNYFKKTNPFLKARRENNFFHFTASKTFVKTWGAGSGRIGEGVYMRRGMYVSRIKISF